MNVPWGDSLLWSGFLFLWGIEILCAHLSHKLINASAVLFREMSIFMSLIQLSLSRGLSSLSPPSSLSPSTTFSLPLSFPLFFLPSCYWIQDESPLNILVIQSFIRYMVSKYFLSHPSCFFHFVWWLSLQAVEALPDGSYSSIFCFGYLSQEITAKTNVKKLSFIFFSFQEFLYGFHLVFRHFKTTLWVTFVLV